MGKVRSFSSLPLTTQFSGQKEHSSLLEPDVRAPACSTCTAFVKSVFATF